ncbi:kinase-like domain-containing protein [Panaeolus papilionaceus]|nr:kinase-like domain-containing protein [Panaeolus papilionaceus]
MDIVFHKTTIPIPPLRRVIRDPMVKTHVIVMDMVPGKTLFEAWPTLGLFDKLWVAITLRGYVQQLRKLTAPPGTPPGPISGTSLALECVSDFITLAGMMPGPYESYGDMANQFNNKLRLRAGLRRLLPGHPTRQLKFDHSQPMVLTHLDLNPGNVILGQDGQLWLIDFGSAGYYPVWAEYLVMSQTFANSPLSWIGEWGLIAPLVCGPHFYQKYFMEQVAM